MKTKVARVVVWFKEGTTVDQIRDLFAGLRSNGIIFLPTGGLSIEGDPEIVPNVIVPNGEEQYWVGKLRLSNIVERAEAYKDI
ncbi:MAG: hypothetical protein HY225_01615 [Candidatus Vogelbacteria bacterium]|nr:hypothetical protein [Candidatus Vogelbacteria bacterium]